jgi:hypothetical protein
MRQWHLVAPDVKSSQRFRNIIRRDTEIPMRSVHSGMATHIEE